MSHTCTSKPPCLDACFSVLPKFRIRRTTLERNSTLKQPPKKRDQGIEEDDIGLYQGVPSSGKHWLALECVNTRETIENKMQTAGKVQAGEETAACQRARNRNRQLSVSIVTIRIRQEALGTQVHSLQEKPEKEAEAPMDKVPGGTLWLRPAKGNKAPPFCNRYDTEPSRGSATGKQRATCKYT